VINGHTDDDEDAAMTRQPTPEGEVEEAIRLSRPIDLIEFLTPEPDSVTITILWHAATCAYFQDRDCDCDPEIELRRATRATVTHPAEPGQG
jgi:hypothetical protein